MPHAPTLPANRLQVRRREFRHAKRLHARAISAATHRERQSTLYTRTPETPKVPSPARWFRVNLAAQASRCPIIGSEDRAQLAFGDRLATFALGHGAYLARGCRRILPARCSPPLRGLIPLTVQENTAKCVFPPSTLASTAKTRALQPPLPPSTLPQQRCHRRYSTATATSTLH
jgi:hypothetical protein